MANLDETPIIELGQKPIPGDQPCGIDVTEDEGYLFAQSEAAKLDRIEAGEPDWFKLEQATSDILRSKSKDVEIACILGLSLFKRHRYAGLAAALKLITELVNNFWDGCFPDRPRRRKTRIESLADRFTEGKWFREHPPGGDDFDAIDLSATRINELEAALKAKMPEDPPDFGKFVQAAKELAGRRPQSGASVEGSGGTTASAAAPAAGTFSAAEVADAGGANNAILAAATFLRKADPTDPVPYAIVRTIRWSRISLPTSDAGKYQIPPPESSVTDALTHQFNNGLWENLLKNAESAFRSNDPLWLDLQRYACTAMTRLGPNYDRARQAVTSVTAGLINRLGNGLYDLKFRNGMALCSGETRLWIESEVAPPQQGGASRTEMGDGRLTESSDKARKLAGEGKVKEALEQLREGLTTSTEQRDRFLWRLAMAKLCSDAQRLQLALPLLEECRDEIGHYHIAEWEPSLALDVAQMLYRCRKASVSSQKEPSREALEGVRNSFSWLCQLDPVAALAAGEEKGSGTFSA